MDPLLMILAALAFMGGGTKSGSPKGQDKTIAALRAQYIASVRASGIPGAGAMAAALEHMSDSEIASMEVPVVGAPIAVAEAIARHLTGKDYAGEAANYITGHVIGGGKFRL